MVTVTPYLEEPDRHRLVAHHKSNYGPLAEVERWRIVPKEIAASGGEPIQVMTIEFVEVAEGVSREDVGTSSRGREKPTQAEALVLSELAHGRRLSAEEKATGLRQGMSERTTQAGRPGARG